MKKASQQWKSIIALFLCTFFWGGFRSTYGVFFKEMLATLDWPAIQLASLQSLNLLIYGLGSPLIGWLIARYREVDYLIILLGWALTTVGLAAGAFAHSYLALLWLYGVLLGLGTTMASPVSFNIALNRRITYRSGLAIGLVSAGVGIGTFLLTPQIQRAILYYGWRQTMIFLSFPPLALGLQTLLLLERHPKERLAFPKTASTGGMASLDWYKNVALIIFTPLQFFVIQFFITHGIKMMDIAGIIASRAASIFALSGILNAIGRVIFGYLLDRVSLSLIGCINYSAILFTGVSALLLSVYNSAIFAYITFATMGLAWAISIPQTVVIFNKAVGSQRFALYYGLTEAMIGFVGSLGAMVGGISLDFFNGYEFGIFICIICIGLSILSYVSVLRTLKRQESWAK
jgi:MFS family permease